MVDLHNDIITEVEPRRLSKYFSRAKKVGVDTIVVSAWTTLMGDPIKEIKFYRKLIDELNTGVKLLLHVEDAWFLTKENIDEFLSCKPYSVGLTWNQDNDLAGGAHTKGNLTELGKFVVEKLSSSGVVIDLAHLNRKSFFQVTELLKGKRLFCSHTCFDELHIHPRNLESSQIQTIIASGGLIGLTLVNDFLGSEDFYQHIAYFVENYGDKNLGIGTDFFGTQDLPKNLKSYKDLRKFKKSLNPETAERIFHKNWYDFQKPPKKPRKPK